MTSGATPIRSRTPSRNTSLLLASRVADVATNRVASTPSSLHWAAYASTAANVRSSASAANSPVWSTPCPRRTTVMVRLGQGVDQTGEFAADALERTFAAVDAYAAQCKELGVEATRFVATSATRDASNRDVFLEGVRERMGVAPEVITGDEEARLSFRGATSVLDASHDAP